MASLSRSPSTDSYSLLTPSSLIPIFTYDPLSLTSTFHGHFTSHLSSSSPSPHNNDPLLHPQTDAFTSTSTLLGGTFKRMNKMAKKQGGNWCWFMLFLILVLWIFIVVWFKRKTVG
jgi:hypothetical protein